MCGIAGSVNFSLPQEILKKTMHHRGPDDQQGFAADNVNFYHLRLSILDFSGGKQPMSLNDRYTIIFNGEIYNHLELRQQFGLVGKTYSDTETILLLYQKLGSSFLQHLDGMFVFAIYDNIEKNIFIARDRAGEKPLYIFNDGEKIVFASELNSLKAILPLQIEHDNFYHYMRFGMFYRNLTPYKKVAELIAGSFIIINCKTLEIAEQRWWNIHDFYLQGNNDSFETSLEKTKSYLHKSVKRRIESSDLDVGCFLSGGIDSGLIVAIASEYTSKLKTITISLETEYDETQLAKLVAEKYNTSHTEISISLPSLINGIEKILCNYGEPFFDSSAIPSYYVSQGAKKHVTVILNGDGADELFGGYRRYVPFSKFDFFKNNDLIKKAASFLKNTLPLSNNKKSTYFYLNRLISLASKSNLEVYLSAGVDLIEDYEENILSSGYDYLSPMRNDFNKISQSSLSGLNKIMNLDFDTILFSDLLMKMDIATMVHSVEGRNPFLSKELLEYAPGMNDSFKIKGKNTKHLLRTLAKEYLPETLINQPKRGFEIPLKKWVNNELKDMIHDYIESPSAFTKTLIDPTFTHNLLHQKINIPAEKRAKMLWMLFSMEVWYKKVYLNS